VVRRNGHDVVENATVYMYNAVGSRESVTLPNQAYTMYGYNALNRLTSVSNFKAGGTSLSSFAYSHCADGMRAQVAEDFNNGGNVHAIVYTYDAINRVIGEDASEGTSGYEGSYTYDVVGNRLLRRVEANGSQLHTKYEYDMDAQGRVKLDRLMKETYSSSG